MLFQRIHWRSLLTFNEVNPVVRLLTISDIMISGGFGLIAPIFAVFISDNIKGGSLEVVGLSSAIYLFSKSVGQIPAAIIIDRIKGEVDDFWALFAGSFFYSIVPILYIFVCTPSELYILQFFHGLAAAMTLPSWLAIFTRHIDKNREGFEWGAYHTLVDLSSAASASLGGFMAYRFGFKSLFLLVSFMSFLGTIFLFSIYGSMRRPKKSKNNPT